MNYLRNTNNTIDISKTTNDKDTFIWIMSNENIGQLSNFGDFIKGALKLRCQ